MMSSSLDPARAPVGDVAAALMCLDALLARVEDPDAGRDRSAAQVIGAEHLEEVIGGYGTLIYLYMTYLRHMCQAHDRDLLQEILPSTIATLARMTRSVPPEVIPTMTALVTAAALDLSPGLWRAQYGPWQEQEYNALEATTLVLATRINDHHGDPQAATRIAMDALTAAESDSDTDW